MEQKRRFNLVDEEWIPVAGVGKVSLHRIFVDPSCKALGGTPLQKIALLKVLLAIMQAACRPLDERDWASRGPQAMAALCDEYLQTWHDAFWLYGEAPFLQIPGVAKAATQNLGAVSPGISTGNTTILYAMQMEKKLDDAEKALLVVQLAGFGLGGKKTDNALVLTPGYTQKTNAKGKAATGKPGASLGFLGILHHFLLGTNLQESLWLNILTQKDLQGMSQYSQGQGLPPWEKMPQGEDCPTARALRDSLMGRLVPLSKFCLLHGDSVHYTDGIAYPTYKEGALDPSVAMSGQGDKAKVLWADPEKQPWRNLTALLRFLDNNPSDFGMVCQYIRCGLLRARKTDMRSISLWAGGLRVSNNAGEQYASGSNDYVESQVSFSCKDLEDGPWYDALQTEMNALNALSNLLYKSVLSYHGELKGDGKDHAAQASHLFWQLCERYFQNLVLHCTEPVQCTKLRIHFADIALQAYTAACPNNTARQMDAWAKQKPRTGQYLTHLKDSAYEN